MGERLKGAALGFASILIVAAIIVIGMFAIADEQARREKNFSQPKDFLEKSVYTHK